MTYADFIARRASLPSPVGLEGPFDLLPELFPHQRDLVGWALRKGRAAIFADTGLGKTLTQLEWARVVAERVGPVLILTPLAVADQTVVEARRFGIRAEYRREDDPSLPITVANYEMLPHFDADRYAGVVLDESSILKAYDGKTRNAIIGAFGQTPYRLACTATPAPNDHTELGNHSEFLGVKSRVEMLAEYFVHDGGSTQNWRLKGHAEDVFWRWVCTWGAVVKMPSDLGHDDAGYVLPDLVDEEVVVPIDHQDAWSEGYLFAPDVSTLADQRATRRATLDKRVAAAAAIANGTSEPVLIWGELNAETEAAAAAIPDAVEVRGSDSPEVKRDRLIGFAGGQHRVLVTKPKIAGFGMNWQHCSRVVFLGASHSYEQTYQAIRRCWRFGQTRPVTVTVIRAETEGPIMANYRRKEADAARLAEGMLAHMRESMQSEIRASKREWNDYDPRVPMTVPSWVGKEEAE
jgi:hypothetical protein